MERNQSSTYRRSGRYQKKQGGEWPQILLFYVLPFLLFNGILFYCVIAKPRVTVAVADTNDYLSTEVTLTVNSWFPTRSVDMTIDGEELELVRGKNRTYTTTLDKNGSIEATVVNLNGMPTTVFELVSMLDENPPSFEQADILDGIVTLTVADSQSGINFDSIYALNSADQQVTPLTVDRSTNTLSYEMDPAGLHVYAQDKAGNEVQGTFTSHKEGDVEQLEGGADAVSTEEAAGADAGAAEAETSADGTAETTTAATSAAGGDSQVTIH